MIASSDADLVQAFTAAFTTDDVESFYELIDPDAEWTIMGTGETFRSLEKIKQLATLCRDTGPRRWSWH
ncbi:MAG: nuclear transport factor 2-like protein [Candidatus Tyrphobacter sp.]